MLLNSIRLFEAPLQHLNLIQNLSQKVVTVGCMAFFLSLFFLSISSLEQVDLVNFLCYFISHVRDLFLKFYICTDYNLQPSSIFYFHLVQPFVFSSLLLSWMLDISYMWRVNIIFGYTSIVSPRLNCRLGNNLENTKKNMISL